MLAPARKLVRFASIYGPRRALFKAAGRMRLGRAIMFGAWPWPVKRDVGVIGCGQFAFATIGYIVATRIGNRFVACYDPNGHAAASFARFYGCKPSATAADVLADPRVAVVYIASNHSTHAGYAIDALRANKLVYVEKPIAVSNDQLSALLDARRQAPDHLFAGYNRPFSAAVRELKTYCAGAKGPLTLSCIIAGHMIPRDHWYRELAEGTRICGNLGHWLDLMVHIMSWRRLPRDWRIVCAWS